MSERIVKCFGTCGNKYPKSQMNLISNKNHCPTCYDKKITDKRERELLYQYLQDIFNLKFPTGLMLKQIKELVGERNYTYKNIRFTVDYIIRIKKINLQMKYGIAMVPHLYDEMIDYYKNLKERRSKTFSKEIKVQTIKIEPFVFENEYKAKKLIDMETILNDSYKS